MNKYYAVVITLFLISSSLSAQVTYDSQNISLLSNWFNPNEPVATSYGIKYNGIWGWHDGNGNEYALVGAASGTYFIDVTNDTLPVQRDYVAGRLNNCVWREIKTYQNYCYMVSDDGSGSTNSLQIVDLSYLPDSVHLVYDDNVLFGRSHTIFIEGNKLYGGYVHGGSVGSASMAVFDLSNPASPVLLRRLNDDYPSGPSQVHDMLVRNDTIYASCGYDGLYIYKLLPNNHFSLINSLTTYIDQGYNHSSAITEDGQRLVFTDEVPAGMDVKILDVSNPNNLTVTANFHSHPDATAHNPFILNNLCYMAYYQDGLQVFDVSNGALPVRVGYFDTYHQNPAGTYLNPAYAGSWGAYPYLPSGNVLVSDMQNGLYVLDVSLLTGIKNKTDDAHFAILPNPVAKGNDVLVQFKNRTDNARYTVTDISGKIMNKGTATGNYLELKTTNLQSGIYIVTVEGNDFRSAEKFIITD